MCRSTSKPTDNVTVTIRYIFDAPINQDEEEDLELSEVLARLLEQKVDIIQPYYKSIETINIGTQKKLS